MRLIDLLRLALGRLGTGKLRTALTMLGIIIGVASVVALVSVAQGATKGISEQLNALGTNLLTVTPGFSRGTVTRGSFGSPPKSFSIFSAELRSLPSKRCPYVSIVSLIEECPRRSEIFFGWTPSWIKSEACVWRRSYSRSFGRSFASQIF